MEHGNINAKKMWKVIANACNKNKMLLVSCDEKCEVKVGTPGNPLAPVSKSKAGWIATSAETKAVDHDAFIKSNCVPSTMLIIDITKDLNLGKFHKGEFHVGLKYNYMYEAFCVRYEVEIAKVLEENSKDKALSCISADRGGDRNPKFE